MNESIEENAQMMQVPVFARNANAWVFCQMREEFYYCNVEDAYKQLGSKATGYRTIVARWIKNGWVEKVDKDRFRKTELGLQICNQMSKASFLYYVFLYLLELKDRIPGDLCTRKRFDKL